MSQTMRCLSTHGQFLVYDTAARELRTSFDANHPNIIFAKITDGRASLFFKEEANTWYVMPGNFGTSVYSDEFLIADRLTTTIVDGEFVYFEKNGQHLSAEPDGSVNFKIWKEVYEKFWLFSDSSLPFLLSNNSWFSASLGRVVDQHEIRIMPNFKLSIGELDFDFKNIVKYGYNNENKEINLVYEGYKVERLLLFKPLIYFSAYGKEQSFELLKMCIESIEKFGNYSGDYLVITNKSEYYVRELLSFIDPQRLQIAGIPVIDETDMVCARFKIVHAACINDYQPILYSDFDIICNASLKDMLRDILGSDNSSHSTIYVKSEGPLDHHSYGSVLTLGDKHSVMGRGDKYSTLRTPIGFNSGVIGFKNAKSVKSDFISVVNCIYSQIENGVSRQSAEVYDQPAANYVYNKVSCYDVSVIDKYIHPWPPLENEKINGRGLVHFCGGVGPLHKIDRIKSYYSYIISQH